MSYRDDELTMSEDDMGFVMGADEDPVLDDDAVLDDDGLPIDEADADDEIDEAGFSENKFDH